MGPRLPALTMAYSHDFKAPAHSLITYSLSEQEAFLITWAESLETPFPMLWQEVCRDETQYSVSSHACAPSLHSPTPQTTWRPLLPLAMDILAGHISSSKLLGISGSLQVTSLSNQGTRCDVRMLLEVLCLEATPGQLELTCHTRNQSGPHSLLLDHKDPSLPGCLCLAGPDFSINSFSPDPDIHKYSQARLGYPVVFSLTSLPYLSQPYHLI